MKKNKKIITICTSVSFYKNVIDVEKKLKQLGFLVKIPSTVHVMKKTGNFDADAHKTWFANPNDYKLKTKFMKEHFKMVVESDAILVLNLDKKGIKGYIGGNVLMEMVLAFHYKKPIFLFKAVSKELHFLEEIVGMNPIVIDQDLSKIVFRKRYKK